MNSRTKKISTVLLCVFAIYLLSPFFAGLLKTDDRRGPKVFFEGHHELLYYIGYYMAGHDQQDGKPRVPWRERPWFYGLAGKKYEALAPYNDKLDSPASRRGRSRSIDAKEQP